MSRFDITVAFGASERCPLSTIETKEVDAAYAALLGRAAVDVEGTNETYTTNQEPTSPATTAPAPIHLKYAGKRSFKSFAREEKQMPSGYRVECTACEEGKTPRFCPNETPIRILAARVNRGHLLKKDRGV